MALDGIVTRAIVHELQQCIGGRINKIHQPSTRDIIFNMRAQGKNVKLLLSANATYPRVHFTEQSFPNPPEAPMFCMLLRKHCEGGFIEAVSQVGMERIIHIDVRQRDELGDVSLKRIIIELMGRHSNLILVDPQTGVQLDGIHHITPSISSFRVVMPGTVYSAPPEQHKLNPLEVTKEQFIAAYHKLGVASTNWLVESFSGISPLIANEIIVQTPAYQEQRDINQLWETFSKLMNQVKQHEYAPMLGDNEQQKSIFSVIPLSQITSNLRQYDSISECMEAYYGDKALRDTVKQKSSDLLRFLQNERNKNVKKLTKLQQDLLEADDAERYRIAGELLFASLHSVNKGDKQVELVNYYEESQPIEKIQLDPLLTPSENAQKYFKKYNKFKNSLAVIEEQMKLANEEIRYIEGLLQQLQYATLSDIDEIREELITQGYLRDRGPKGKKKKKNDRPTLHVYTSSEGIELYVGKNNIQNEYVTNKVGKPNDTWLHTKDIPGSHVLIRSETYSEDTLHEAAQLAAYFSQAKSSSSVPVDYTLIRHVRKPSGAKPGFVIYDNQKTLFVTPDEDLIKGLRSQTKNN
ncbi:putative ribosome quality control (RQC) complex YloA/Tae2 family protein [Paenibacillus turicensis]|uniref:Rqc2 homolog RqcH n=1 Tax=Paenibacillus turicensis TaxID=160487 RepID=A0ABS4FPL8_9BACL|nr:NFACT RNA binding domain-containing protein [Paenibacillus turicensis]MBP1904486.1 putative ribosome quality control (RQC) complex YloA/Tae2 family protein [Paenibacillus turicensis]